MADDDRGPTTTGGRRRLLPVANCLPVAIAAGGREARRARGGENLTLTLNLGFFYQRKRLITFLIYNLTLFIRKQQRFRMYIWNLKPGTQKV
jgi:hypothetical protein